MDCAISKDKSDAIKVVAVIMMVIFHTFAFPERIQDVAYISLWKMADNVTIEYFLARFGGICVEIFLFLSGYGMYVRYKDQINYTIIKKRLRDVYINYWIVLFIFFPIGIALGKYRFEIKEFVMNFLALISSYNGEWWFLGIYIVLMIMYPLQIKLVRKMNGYMNFITILGVTLLGMVIVKVRLVLNINFILLNLMGNVLAKQFTFSMGILVAKYGVFSKLEEKIKVNKVIYSIVAVLIIFIKVNRINIPLIDEFIIMGLNMIFIYLLVALVPEKSVLNKLNSDTTNIWLVHSFFCYHLFQDIAFFPRYSVLIIIWILFLSVIVSRTINKLLRKSPFVMSIFLTEHQIS